MATATPVSMDEYLNSGYEWDAEFVDGELKERPAVFPGFAWSRHFHGLPFSLAPASEVVVATSLLENGG